ncbi:MAG: biopolymer transporter ExbD [Desulfuromonas sp.]|nr:MAG: biopolymer transporter ExbD [Desulfuromonas sp.]
MAFRRRSKENPRVELTPMVDVVFLLLIFFMISTTFIETQGLTIKLPGASAAKLAEQPEELQVYLSKDGEIFLKDEEVSLSQLQVHLAGYGTKARKTMFLLLADREARHGGVVQLMDLAKKAGFKKLAIATEKQE